MSNQARVKAHLQIRYDKNLKCKPQNHQCGDVCVPKSKKCSLSEQHIETIVKRYEDKIKNKPIEYAIAVDDGGKAIVYKSGTEINVNFTAEEVQRMKGTVITHNHPNVGGWGKDDPRSAGFSFSEDDIRSACIIQPKEIRAVTSGYRHTLKPPEQGWNSFYFDWKVKPVYDKHRVEVFQEFEEGIIRGIVAVPVAEREYWHEVNRRTARDTGMIYKREPI